MFGVVANAKGSFDQRRDAFGRPQVIGPPVSNGPLVEQGFESVQLVVTQTRLAARNGLGVQTIGLPGKPPPPRQGAGGNAQDARYDAGAFASVNQLNSALAGAVPVPVPSLVASYCYYTRA